MIDQPKLRPCPKENRYELIEDYTYSCSIDGQGLEIKIPRGFLYNGASIPWFGWTATYTPFHPDVMLPALIHDWLYGSHETDRETADSILYQLLIENNVDKGVAEIMFQAVRIGGRSAWDN